MNMPSPFTIDDLLAGLAARRLPLVLDVRELSESRHGHIPGATRVPRRRIESCIDALVADRATPLVSGAPMSSKACGRRIGDLDRVPTAAVDALQRWRAEGARVALCDVRSAAEHTEGCVPGAVSMPGFEVVQHALDMTADPDGVVPCSTGGIRSMVLARTLIELGLSEVVALDGGTRAGQLAGLELEQGSRCRRGAPSTAGGQFAQLGVARLAKHRGVQGIDAEALAALLATDRRNLHVFDLRDRGRHAVAHVPRSVSVASDHLIVRNEELVGVRDAPTVLVDDDPVRALLTAVWMRRLGHPHVRVLAGGFAAWTQAGHASAKGHEAPQGWREASAATPGLGAADAAHWLAAHAPAHILRVDTGASCRRAHLPGAVGLRRGWLDARPGALAPSLGQALLVTCVDGSQAAFAAAALRDRGHVQVAWLQGGPGAWAAAGKPLEAAAAARVEDELPLPARRDEQATRAYPAWELSAHRP